MGTLNKKMITITETAAEMILDTIDAQEMENVYLELRITGGGCSGLQYALGLTELDDIGIDEVVHESNGVKIVVDPKSLAYIDGTELDFVREGINEGFKFNNPNVKNECGCGESFTV